ncbi:MAG TPA: hypothetical protein VN969_28670 [Streptosporangiaceae bacterium]|jgi:hypothetical protein|nr:hypothetical protein [Streptosporangiaceae bacterium]
MFYEPEAASPRHPAAARFGAAGVVLGTHAALWLMAAPIAVCLLCLDATLAAIVLLTALYASPHFSDRAFRLLSYFTQPRPLPAHGCASSAAIDPDPLCR